MSRDSVWVTRARHSYSRRTLFRSAALVGAGLSGAALIGCGETKSQPAANSKTAPRSAATSSIIGRSSTPVPGDAVVSGGMLHAPATANPPTLDPQRTSSANTMVAVASGAMSRLVLHKPSWDPNEANNNLIGNDLALSIESPDAATWTLKLRPGAKFHNVAPVNGHAVEAEDVKATFARALQPANPNRGSLLMIDPDQIESPARDTVVFKLRYPYAQFPHLLASGIHSWIFPREAAAGSYDPATTVIGSGPFIMDSYTPDVAFLFKKNPDWYDKSHPNIDSVQEPILPVASQRWAQFTGGHLDYISMLTAVDATTLQGQNPKAEVLSNWDPGDGQIYFQLGDPASPFQDIRLRRAVSLALDRAAIGQAVYGGKWAPCFNVPNSWGKWALKMQDLPPDAQDWYKFDLLKAKQLVQAAGATNLAVKFAYPTPYPMDPYLRTVAETVSNMLSALGWTVTFSLIDYNKDWVGGGKGMRYGNFPGDTLVFAAFENRPSPDLYLYDFWHSKSTANQSGLKDAKLDAMIDKARTIVNEDEAVKAYLDVQRYLAENMYSAAGGPSGLSWSMVQTGVHNYLTGDTYGSGTSVWSNLWLKR